MLIALKTTDMEGNIGNCCVDCIEDQNLTHNINAEKFFSESRNLIGIVIF
jgi:hypothetical protein